MKKALTKIPAIIGMILTLICIFYLLKAYACSYFPNLFDDGSNIYDPEMTAWGTGLFSIIVSVFSLIFYGFGGPKLLIMMTMVVMLDYIAALLLDKDEKNNSIRKLILILTVVFSLILSLFIFCLIVDSFSGSMLS